MPVTGQAMFSLPEPKIVKETQYWVLIHKYAASLALIPNNTLMCGHCVRMVIEGIRNTLAPEYRMSMEDMDAIFAYANHNKRQPFRDIVDAHNKDVAGKKLMYLLKSARDDGRHTALTVHPVFRPSGS
jgi:hypothetical protein